MSTKKKVKKTITPVKKFLAVIYLAGCVSVALFFEPPHTVEAKAPQPRKPDLWAQDAAKTPVQLAHEICPAYSVPKLFVETILQKESGGRADAIRHEPSQMSRAKSITRNASEQMMYASSIGPMQVMGWWAPEFGMTWNELVDVRTNVEVACRIMARCLATNQAKKKADHYYRAARCYNGSGPRAEAYAQDFMRILSAKALDDMAG